MIIVNIAPNAQYNDYWGYQDNLLPKYQKTLGHSVTIITTDKMHKDGKIVKTTCGEYDLADGVHVIRKSYKKCMSRIMTNIFSYIPVLDLLEQIKPDFIFFHGLVSCTIFDVIKYKKQHPDCIVVQDNHLDYNIGFKQKTIKEKILKSWYRFLNKQSIRFVSKVYGVTPWRCKYAADYFGIPNDKLDLLIMGADDDKMHFDARFEIREKVRGKLGIKQNDYLIVTGGKIDRRKKIDVLMKACMNLQGVKLLVFGNVASEIEKEFTEILSQSTNIIFIGWIDSDKVYELFYASDLAFFPGQHSVLWEQACASKVPCVFEKWDMMDHVDNGGNSDFVSPITVENIQEKIKNLLWTDKYYQMKKVAESPNTDIFLYSHIAKKSLECAVSKTCLRD
jgi:glycosyltransferase involved in cell wall biosynthesis